MYSIIIYNKQNMRGYFLIGLSNEVGMVNTGSDITKGKEGFDIAPLMKFNINIIL